MNKAEIKIRKLKRSDVNHVYNVSHRIKEFTVSDRIHFYEKKEMVEWIGKKDSVFLVAEVEKRIVWFIFCKIISKEWAMLDSLEVDQEFRSQGIGTKLVNALFDELNQKHITFVQAFVGKNYKKSRKFWKECGFIEGKEFIWVDKILRKKRK